MRPNRSRLVGMFREYTPATPPPKNITIKKKPENQKSRFEKKLKEEEFDQFTSVDWLFYFKFKASQYDINYKESVPKDKTILTKLARELTFLEIKVAIDFLFDSDQDILDKKTIGIWALSGGWLNTIYQNSQLWIEGNYLPKNSPPRRREWTTKTDRSIREKKKIRI